MEQKYVTDLQGNKVLPITHVDAVRDDEGNSLPSILGAFEDEVRGLVDTPHQEYVTVAATSQTTAAEDVLPASGQSADTIYRVSSWDGSANSGAGAFDVTVYSEYAWDDVSNPNKYVFLCVKSQIDEVFDISVYNNNTKYANLSAALGTNGANVPESVRKGGMSVKYVHSSDNNYVQARYMLEYANTTTGNKLFANAANWQEVKEKPTKNSKALVEGGGVVNYIEGKEQNYLKNISVLGTGAFTDDIGYGTISSIPCKEGDVIEWSSGIVNNTYKALCIYNAAGVKLTYWTANTSTGVRSNMTIGTYSTPVSYLSYCFKLDSIDAAYVKINGVVVSTPNNEESGVLTTYDKVDNAFRNEDNELYVNFDKQLVATTVNDSGEIVSSSANYCVGVIKVSKSDVYRIKMTMSAGALVNNTLWFSKNNPQVGTTGLKKIRATVITTSNSPVIFDNINFDEDGYIVFKYYMRNNIQYRIYKLTSDLISKRNYLQDSVTLSGGTAGSVVDALPESNTFGQLVTRSGSSYRASNYVNIEGAKFIRVLSRNTDSNIYPSSDAVGNMVGSVFYDDNYTPISTITAINYNLNGYSEISYVKVPATAVYARFTYYPGEAVYLLSETISSKITNVDNRLTTAESTLSTSIPAINESIKELDGVTEGIFNKDANFESIAFINNRGVVINASGSVASVGGSFNDNCSYIYAKKGDVFKFDVIAKVNNAGIIFAIFDVSPTQASVTGTVISNPKLKISTLTTLFVEIPKDGYFAFYKNTTQWTRIYEYKYNSNKYTAQNLYLDEEVLQLTPTKNKVINVVPSAFTEGVVGEAVDFNTGSNYGCNTTYIDVTGVKYIKISVRKSKASFTRSTNVTFGSIFYDSNKDAIANSGINIEYFTGVNSGGDVAEINSEYMYLNVPDNAKYFRYTGYCYGSFLESIWLLRESVKDRIKQNDSQTDYSPLLKQAKNVVSGSSPSAVGLLHFSDIHFDNVAATTINEWTSKYQSYINDVICTGDIINDYLQSNRGDVAWWRATDIARKSLFVLGNHDQVYSNDVVQRYKYFWADAGENGDGNIDTTIARSEAIKPSHEFSFNKYFADFIAGWGVTPPTGYDDPTSPYYQACYWHKDYTLGQKNIGTSSNPVYVPVGVRLIGIDGIYRFDGILAKDGNGNFIVDENTGLLTIADGGEGFAKLTTEQETWLYSKLNETLDSNNPAYHYSVVVVCHYPLDDCNGFNTLGGDGNRGWANVNNNGGIVLNHKTGDTVNFHYGSADAALTLSLAFNMRNRVQSNNTYGYDKGSVNNIGDIIHEWQDRARTQLGEEKFVAWICGHTHVDRFYYPAKYPNILCVVNDQAGTGTPSDIEYRNANDNTNTLANFYSIDPYSGLFKIVRFGLNSDKLLAAKNYLCYNYKNKIVINEG